MSWARFIIIMRLWSHENILLSNWKYVHYSFSQFYHLPTSQVQVKKNYNWTKGKANGTILITAQTQKRLVEHQLNRPIHTRTDIIFKYNPYGFVRHYGSHNQSVAEALKYAVIVIVQIQRFYYIHSQDFSHIKGTNPGSILLCRLVDFATQISNSPRRAKQLFGLLR